MELRSSDQIDFEELIYESEPIHKIEELSYNALQNYSQQFRASYIHFEKEIQNEKVQLEIQHFHKLIVKLIGMIQPSKLAISQMLSQIKGFVNTYYPEDSKIQLRKAAKQKNILVLNKLTIDEEKQLFLAILESLDHLKRCLLLRQSQLGMVLFIQDNRKKMAKAQFRFLYQTNFKDILQYVIPTEKCFETINYFLLEKILEQQFTFYQQFSTKSSELREEISICQTLLQAEKIIKENDRIKIDNLLKSMKVIASKITTIADLFPFACIKSQDDLFSKEKNDPRWKRLFNYDIIEYKIYGEAKKIHESFDNLKANLNIINAAMNIMAQKNQTATGLKAVKNVFESFGKVIQVAVSKSLAHKQAEIMISDPSQKLAKTIWNLPQRKQFKTFIQMSLPSITFSDHFFIPRLLKRYFHDKINQKQSFLPDFDIKNHAAYFNHLVSDQDQENKVSIRINNHFTLTLKEFQDQNNKPKNFFTDIAKNIKVGVDNIKNKFTKKFPPPKTVIFHIHGGGFISMSSFIHQTYTRNWANNLQIPIVSVDYRKAPEHPYPQGLQDCLEAYLWTLNCMNQLYEFEPQKIVLVGDSAGGNLVAALVNLLIEWKLRIPDGIVLVYPALNLNYFDYSPSLLTALNDMILPHTFLKICLKSYLKDPKYRPDQDYFVSPILTPPQVLKQYPPTRIFVGSKDPFHDDCCRLAEKFSQIQPNKVKLKVFQQFPHGFLQFDMKNQPHYYCREATKEVEEALKDLTK